MKGFKSNTQLKHTATYWIASYLKDNEDEPLSIKKQKIEYLPGQDKDKLMLCYCHSIFKSSPEVWEVLVHRGPHEVPDSGDQVVARVSREPFRGSEELTI